MKRLLQGILSGYKRWISPLLPHSCRFVPTCSEYAAEAMERHGVIAGVMLACGRLLRCHPFARAGYDPVPQKFWLNGTLPKARFPKPE
jgi:putative membrane protein insertion efficiency factor